MPDVRLALAAAAIACVATGVGAETVRYPEWIYPVQVLQARRTSEVPFAETPETLRWGFSRPFPGGPRRSFTVDDYGAVPDGQTDCTGAFYDALAAARACGLPAEVVFGKTGRYYCRPNRARGSDDDGTLSIKGVTNLIVRGQGGGTILTMGEPSLGGMWASNSTDVMLQDFAVDYNPLPFTQGRVTEIDVAKGELVLRVGEGYPTPAAVKAAVPEQLAGYKIASARDGAYRWPVITPLFVSKVQLVSGRDWRFTVDPKALPGYLAPGDDFIYVGRRFGQPGVGAADSRGFYVKGVTVHAATTTGMILARMDGVHIDGYADTSPIGSNRLQASNADGIWTVDIRGGITVQNSTFCGQGDDCINLHCLALRPEWVTVVSDREIVLKTDAGARAGDRLEVCDPHQGKIKGQVGVASVSRDPGSPGPRLKLAGSLAATGYDPGAGNLYNVSWAAPSFKLVGNYFGQNRSRCLLIQARGGLIEANTFENAEGYGVVLSYCATGCPEGVIPSDVIVRRNVFRNVTDVGSTSAIDIFDASSFRNYHNLLIENNRFINPRKMAIHAVGCDGLRVIDNEASTEAGRRATWNHPVYNPVDCSVYLDNCTDTLVDKLSVRDPNIKEAAVYIGKACEAGTKGVNVRGIEADIPAGIPAVKDARQ